MVQVTPNTVPNMNYDLLWQLRNTASLEVKGKLDDLITQRYVELLEEEVLRLRAQPDPMQHLRTLLLTMYDARMPRLQQIKMLRAAYNLGFPEARDAVDNFTAEQDIPF